MWGGEDLVASLGGSSSRLASGEYREVARQARSSVLLAAGASGVPAIDAVHVDTEDVAGLRAEAEDAAASGFVASACIHPAQVAIIRAAYLPTAADVAWAEELLNAARTHAGVFAVNGRMVDEPLLAQARRILQRSAHR
jgi:citrate lyase subunit beta/citryl-CoA lyase